MTREETKQRYLENYFKGLDISGKPFLKFSDKEWEAFMNSTEKKIEDYKND